MAANKPTAIHYFLIFFVMLSIILGVTTYIFLDEGKELRETATAAKKSEAAQKTAAQNRLAENIELKAMIGHNFDEVGKLDEKKDGTVAGAVASDLARYAPDNFAGKSLSAALAEIRKQLDLRASELQTLQAQKAAVDAKIKTLEQQYVTDARKYDDARATAVTEKTDLVKEHSDAIAALRTELKNANSQVAKLQNDLQQADQSHKQEVAQLTDRITRLTSINDRLRDQLQETQNVSFERPDAEITWVDNNSRLVWLNIGKADNLKTRTTFSIYSRINNGIGRPSTDKSRGPEDIKGSIEVTRIVGPHMAEARIVDEDIYDPITAGDFAYSPIWGANQSEKFAFVGIMDLDGDGKSDRDVLHDLVKAAGSKIQVEIDDEGKRIGTEIDETTKYLVIGDLPDLAQATKQEEKDRISDIVAQHKALKEQAREQGVRWISLNDFLALMGYTPKQRVFRPGDQRPFNLRAGAASTATNESTANRESSGQTAFGRRNRMRAPTDLQRNSSIYGGR